LYHWLKKFILKNIVLSTFKLWLNLAQKYISDLNIDWNKVKRAAFNDRSNPDDDELGIQIVKDLHRTGCSTFSGHENERDRALLKRVLLAFARYNKSIGYCQGFNIIAALILEIVDKKEEDALICMIYLIDHILPEGYFTNSMHSLAIDMAIFRELLRQKKPKLHNHLQQLQYGSADYNNNKRKTSLTSNINNYEPPLTNVFTMQWFLTLFSTCLPKNILLRVWDSIFLDGAEILFRTSLGIWDKLSVSIMKAQSADSFYSMMSVLSIRLLDKTSIDEENDLINKIYSYGSFPLPGLKELKEKFTFNITPFIDANNCKNSKRKTNEGKLIDGIEDHSEKNSYSDSSNMTSLKLRNLNDGEADNYENIDERGEFELRKHSKSAKIKNNDSSSIDQEDLEDLAKMISCFALLMPNRNAVSSSSSTSIINPAVSQKDIMMTAAAAASQFAYKKTTKNNMFNLLDRFRTSSESNSTNAVGKSATDDISTVTPGAFSFVTQMYQPKPVSEKLTMDLNELKKQYEKLKERQKQAYIIIQAATNHQQQQMLNNSNSNLNQSTSNLSTPSQKTLSSSSASQSNNASSSNSFKSSALVIDSPFGILEKSPVVNHLLIKSNDPTKNTLKQTVHLASGGSMDEPIENNPALKEKIKQSNNKIREILHRDNKKSSKNDNLEDANGINNSKPKKPIYYSDDDSEDDEYYNNFNNQDESQDSEADEGNKNNFIEVKNSHEKVDVNNNNNHLLLPVISPGNSSTDSSSTASSSLVSSPILSNKSKTNQNNDINQQNNGSDINQAKKHQKVSTNNNNNNSKMMSKTDVIENLIKEEKRIAPPLNPFPVRQINPYVAKNGLRLGLYK
jgi:hypothetical protein